MADIEITSVRNELRKKDEELLESKRQRESINYKVSMEMLGGMVGLMTAARRGGTSSQGGNGFETTYNGEVVHL